MTERKPRGTTKVRLQEMLEAQQREMERMRTIMEEQARVQSALIASQLGAAEARPRVSPGQLVVGIRNVSNYSLGFTDKTGLVAQDYSLAPSSETTFVPQSQAAIPYAFWQQLKHSRFVKDGMLIRDDSVLNDHDLAAPADGPNDLPPEATANLIERPRKWIVETPEEEMRTRIARMTSAPTLRRILRTVDDEIFAIGEAKYKHDENRAELAVRDLPGSFTMAENLAKTRLEELEPLTKDPSFMRSVRR